MAFDGAAQVTPVPTGQFRWHSPRIDLLPGDNVNERLADALPDAAARDRLIRLTVTGRSPLADRAVLDAAITARVPEFGWFAADLSGLGVEALPEDLDRIDRGGAPCGRPRKC